jgi:hypothetical protein
MGDNIKAVFKEIGCKVAGWIHLTQDTARKRVLVNTVISLQLLEKRGNLLTSSATDSFSDQTSEAQPLHVVYLPRAES